MLWLWSRESFGFGWMFFEESFGNVLVFKGLAEVLLCRDFLTLMLRGGPCIYKLLKACLWVDLALIYVLIRPWENLGMFCVLISTTWLWGLIAYFVSNLQFLLVLWRCLTFFPVLRAFWALAEFKRDSPLFAEFLGKFYTFFSWFVPHVIDDLSICDESYATWSFVMHHLYATKFTCLQMPPLQGAL